MENENHFARDVVVELSQSLEIPDGHYQKATERYASLGAWLEREQSALARLKPSIYPQGSFRLGTAIRPLSGAGQYDMDLVCELALLTKADVSQKQLKDQVGAELSSYAERYAMRVMPEEGKRCWQLDYADDVTFHMDVLPAIPEDDAPKQVLASALRDADPSGEWSSSAIAITDRTRPNYSVIDRDWPQSNPKGYARWFEPRMREVAQARLRALVETRAYAKVEDVPVYAWKTPLQLAIQILKRHRDVMFKEAAERKPISIIISTLSAQAYAGQPNLFDALYAIVNEMPALVRSAQPRVPNPVNPAEDFADRWHTEPQFRLEEAFREWHRQLRADLEELTRGLDHRALQRYLKLKFEVDLPDDRVRTLSPIAPVAAAPVVHLRQEPRPWGSA